MEIDISFGKYRTDLNWKVEYLEWGEFVTRLKRVRRTPETIAEYDKMNSTARSNVKDGPAA